MQEEENINRIISFTSFSRIKPQKSNIFIVIYHPPYQMLFAEAADRYLSELTLILDPERLTFENKRAFVRELKEMFHESTGIVVIERKETELEGSLFGDITINLERNKEKIVLIKGNKDEVLEISGPLLHKDVVMFEPGIYEYEQYISDALNILEFELNVLIDQTSNVTETSKDEDSIEDFSKIQEEASQEEEVFAQSSNSRTSNSVSEEPRTLYFHSRLKKGEDLVTQEKRRKRLSVYGGIAITVLFLFVLIGTPLQKRKAHEAQILNKIKLVQERMSTIESLKELNSESARIQFDEIKGSVLSLTSEDLVKNDAESLLNTLNTFEKDLFKEQMIIPELFFDLSLQSQSFLGKKMILTNGMLYILNANGNSLIELSESSKRARILLGSTDIDGVSDISAYPGRVFTLVDNKIYVFDANGRELADYNGGGGAIVTFQAYTGNLYTLEPDTAMIYKLQGKEEGGYAPASSWLREGVETTFNSPRSMMIDGTIWVLSGENDVFRLALGNVSRFYVPTITPELTRIESLYTNDELESIFLFERLTNRIIEVLKTGELKLQYKAPPEIQLDSFVVSKKESRMYLLSGSKIYVVGL